MDHGHSETGLQTLSASVFVSLAASLTLIALVPAAFWLADHSLLPWQEDLRWTRLRAQLHAPATAADDRVVLSRTGCSGWCPIYTVTLLASGRVVFEGEKYVCAKGQHEALVEMELARDLLADLDAAGFFELTWRQGTLIADAASASMRLVHAGRARVLLRELDDRGAPPIVKRMERAIDDVAGTARWLPGLVGYHPYCTLPDGSRRPLREM
jgi:hypothetical protein